MRGLGLCLCRLIPVDDREEKTSIRPSPNGRRREDSEQKTCSVQSTGEPFPAPVASNPARHVGSSKHSHARRWPIRPVAFKKRDDDGGSSERENHMASPRGARAAVLLFLSHLSGVDEHVHAAPAR